MKFRSRVDCLHITRPQQESYDVEIIQHTVNLKSTLGWPMLNSYISTVDPWKSLEIPGNPWKSLEIPGNPWKFPEIPGIFSGITIDCAIYF